MLARAGKGVKISHEPLVATQRRHLWGQTWAGAKLKSRVWHGAMRRLMRTWERSGGQGGRAGGDR